MNVKIIRSKRRTIALSVLNENDILIKAPYSVSSEFINNFIKSKEDWIIKQVNIIKSRQNDINDFKDCPYLILGKKYQNFSSVKDYSRYYRKFCIEYITKRIGDIAMKYGFKYRNLSFKNYKSRWGSCTINNDISFNYKLILLPEEVVDYVIIHELCHTRYHNHQKRFHMLLSSLCKDEKECNIILKKYSFLNRLSF